MTDVRVLQEFTERLLEDAITDEDRVFAARVRNAAAIFMVQCLQNNIKELEHEIQTRQAIDSAVDSWGTKPFSVYEPTF